MTQQRTLCSSEWRIALAVGLLCLWTPFVWGGAATTLTEAQYQTLKNQITVTDVNENQADITEGRDQVIADRYNQPFTPTFQVFKTAVPRRALLFEKSSADTSFIFVGDGYISRTQQELLTFHDLFDGPNSTMDPSLPNVQQALLDIFSGAAGTNAQKNRVHIGNMSRRPVTRAEKLYVTQGTGSNADPGYLIWEGLLNHRDIAHALRGAPLQ
jgi:hypothetical protein